MEGKSIKRLENWPLMLSSFIKERQNMPFEWGKNDCMLFCADAVLAMTGQDMAAEFRGKYNDKKGAYLSLDGKSLEDVLNSKLVAKEKSFAQRGDVVLVYNNGDYAGGIIDDTGRRVAVLTERGLCRLPICHATMVWGI